jgi:hypothetical protein
MIECAFLGTLSRDAEVKVSKAGKEYLSMNMRVSDGDDSGSGFACLVNARRI